MGKWFFVLMPALLCACQERSSRDPMGRVPDPMLSPVTDADAPTVKAIEGRGYEIVGMREAACDPRTTRACTGFDALYLGRGGVEVNKSSVAEFACPGTSDPIEEWKCRILDPPYVPNDGFAPLATEGS
ncbi:hypothetical protein ACFB49_22410 [Sphingomonas sp. DBB INV C78]